MFLQFLTDFDSLFGEVHLVGQANQHGTFVREEGTCGFLALVVGQGVVVGEAEDFDYEDRSAHASLPPKGRHAHISTKVLSGQRSPTAHRERISWSFTGSPSGKLRKPRAATVLARALPRRGSFCNLSKGNTASLAPWWLKTLKPSVAGKLACT